MMKTKAFPEADLPDFMQEKADRMNLIEADVPPFEILPQPFSADMTPVEKQQVREKTLAVFTGELYGEIPPPCQDLTVVNRSCGIAFDGLAVRRELDIICSGNGISHTLHLLLYLPVKRQGKVPCFLGMNFLGNIATTNDPQVTFHAFTPYPDPSPWLNDNRVRSADGRGKKAYRWEFEKVIKAGFASATMSFGEVFPDHPTGFDHSIMRLFYSGKEEYEKHRNTGAISAWAWGLMRALDALETIEEIDRNKFIVHGLSRMGKTALWAAANDPRIAMAVSFNSGTAGAKMTRRYFGESMEWLDNWRKYWFAPGFEKFCGKDTVMPFDQQQLMALIAPRKLYVASAENDPYADPKGEFLATLTAAGAWKNNGLAPDTPMPEAGTGAGEKSVRYFIRKGVHDCTPENWDDLLKFAAGHFL